RGYVSSICRAWLMTILSPCVLDAHSCSRSWVLAFDGAPVEGVECGDHHHAQHGKQGAEKGACRQPPQGEAKAPADRSCAGQPEAFVEKAVTADVQPDGIERQRGYEERKTVEGNGCPLTVSVT